MITAPEDYVIANGGVRLNRVVLQNKAIISDRRTGKDRRSRADIADERIALGFRLEVLASAPAFYEGAEIGWYREPFSEGEVRGSLFAVCGSRFAVRESGGNPRLPPAPGNREP